MPNQQPPIGVQPEAQPEAIAKNDFAWRSKPIDVEAFQFQGMASLKRQHDVPEWFVDAFMTAAIKRCDDAQSPNVVVIQATNGNFNVNAGDWIVKRESGELLGVRNEVFASSYEKPE